MYSLVDEDVALARTSMSIGFDLTKLSPATPLSELDGAGGSVGALDMLKAATADESLSVLEAARRYAINALCPELVGTPDQVADQMQEIFEQDACDGFVIMNGMVPESTEEFARSVVPILQERGLFRSEYESSTLRGNLDLG